MINKYFSSEFGRIMGSLPSAQTSISKHPLIDVRPKIFQQITSFIQKLYKKEKKRKEETIISSSLISIFDTTKRKKD